MAKWISTLCAVMASLTPSYIVAQSDSLPLYGLLLPGIHIANIGARNESVVWVRGFDLRQVPVFVDGIPVYVPFDGYVDMGRFTTFDLAEIQVAKVRPLWP